MKINSIAVVCGVILLVNIVIGSFRYKSVDHFLQNDVKWRYDVTPNLELYGKDPKIIKTSNKSICENACTLDKDCVAYTFKGVQEECSILSSVDRVTSNTSNDFTTKCAFKRRPTLRNDVNSNKLQEFAGMRLSNDLTGTIATYNNVDTLEKCYNQCTSASRMQNSKKPCIAFEYDYDVESCRLDHTLVDALQKDDKKITYLVSS